MSTVYREGLAEVYQTLPQHFFGAMLEIRDDGCISEIAEQCHCPPVGYRGNTWSAIMSRPDEEVESSRHWQDLREEMQTEWYRQMIRQEWGE